MYRALAGATEVVGPRLFGSRGWETSGAGGARTPLPRGSDERAAHAPFFVLEELCAKGRLPSVSGTARVVGSDT